MRSDLQKGKYFHCVSRKVLYNIRNILEKDNVQFVIGLPEEINVLSSDPLILEAPVYYNGTEWIDINERNIDRDWVFCSVHEDNSLRLLSLANYSYLDVRTQGIEYKDKKKIYLIGKDDIEHYSVDDAILNGDYPYYMFLCSSQIGEDLLKENTSHEHYRIMPGEYMSVDVGDVKYKGIVLNVEVMVEDGRIRPYIIMRTTNKYDVETNSTYDYEKMVCINLEDIVEIQRRKKVGFYTLDDPDELQRLMILD